jgi:hypothetical protein
MFSDRCWLLKLGAALGLLALLSNHTRTVLSSVDPDIERIVLNWTGYRDHTFHLAAKQVLSVDETGFEIGTRVGPMRVRTPNPPRIGTWITANVRPVGPRLLEPSQLKALEGYVWKRPLNYAISVATLLAYLWLIRRRFRWVPEAGVFRSRY